MQITLSGKFLPGNPSRDRQALERLHPEDEAASALSHPNVLALREKLHKAEMAISNRLEEVATESNRQDEQRALATAQQRNAIPRHSLTVDRWQQPDVASTHIPALEVQMKGFRVSLMPCIPFEQAVKILGKATVGHQQ